MVVEVAAAGKQKDLRDMEEKKLRGWGKPISLLLQDHL